MLSACISKRHRWKWTKMYSEILSNKEDIWLKCNLWRMVSMEERGKLCKPNASTKSFVLHLAAEMKKNMLLDVME